MTSFSCLITVTKINSQQTLLEIGFSFTVFIRSFKLVHPTMTGENMAGNSLGCCSLCYCHIWLLFFYLYFFSFCRNFGGNKMRCSLYEMKSRYFGSVFWDYIWELGICNSNLSFESFKFWHAINILIIFYCLVAFVGFLCSLL